MIGVTTSGSLERIRRKVQRYTNGDIFAQLDKYGQDGVVALAAATPTRSGETANSWYFVATRSRGSYSISWRNSNVHNGAVIAILIQYGHATRTGGYVPGHDYINPAIQPIFDRIRAELRKAVTSA